MAETAFRGGNPEIGIVVRDLDVMSRFYQEAVGLPHVVDLPLEGHLMRRLACGDGIVKLLQPEAVPERSNPPGGVTGGTGLRYLTVKVHDIEDAFARCEAAGASVAFPLQEWEGRVMFTILEDPEGNWLELSSPRNQPPGTPAPNPEIGIVTRDLDVMTRLYGDALGLAHLVDGRRTGHLMRRFACGGGVVKLLQPDDVPAQSNPPGGVTGGTGLRYLTVAVDDIEDVARRCEEAGASVAFPIQQASTGTIFTILDDPEGNWLELTMRP
jgi:predicted enzyme related to lactoylglutathione lyase